MVLVKLQSFIVPLGAWKPVTTGHVNDAMGGTGPGSYGVTTENVN